ncbi:hypothetical protein DOY81_003409 [Sarcophaga bullata]|nr:hypothetical protein DOY81_003409 [Sarcophaga bullata]
MPEDIFNKIAAAIGDESESIVQELCQVPRITELTDFYRLYELEEKAIDEKYNQQPKSTPSVETFAAAFKQFEEFPANIQRPKKAPLLRERLNSTISRSSSSLNDSIGNTKESSSSLNNLKDNEIPTASETLSSFNNFQKQLKLLNTELMQQDIEKDYASKLKQLSSFAQQLEKLMPTEKACKSAFTSAEETLLEDLVNRMEDMNFIRSHQNIFRQQNAASNTIPTKLDNLVDVLNYCLLAVNSFNIN